MAKMRIAERYRLLWAVALIAVCGGRTRPTTPGSSTREATARARASTSCWSAATRSTARRRRCRNWPRSSPSGTASTARSCSRSTEDGTINPERRDNIPGLEALETADLMVLFTRFRDLPDDQMKHVVDYVESGRPIIGLRTATHAFDAQGGQDLSPATAWNSKEWDGRASAGRCSARPGSATTAATASRARAGSSPRGREDHPILRGHQGRRHLGPDRRLRRPPAPARRQQAAGARPGPRRDEADGPARRGEEERPDDAGRLDEDLHRRGGQGRAASSRPRWGPRRTWRAKACAGCWSTPATGPSGWRTRSPPRPTSAIVGEYHPRPFGFGGFKKGVKPSSHEIK